MDDQSVLSNSKKECIEKDCSWWYDKVPDFQFSAIYFAPGDGFAGTGPNRTFATG